MRQSLSATLLFLAFLVAVVSPVRAGISFIDLSKAANMGPAQSFDEAVPGGEDLKEKEGFANIPQGPQTLRGIPFLMLETDANQGNSFIALYGRRHGIFPQAVAINVGGIKAKNLYFLHSCRWGGTASNIAVAEYDIVYGDGQVDVIPLKVGAELTNFTGSDDTPESYLAWWHKYKNIDMGLNLFAWKNPQPDVPIQTILFKSMNKAPVPMLFAITASDMEIPISPTSPKPEKTFQTDTRGWFPFQPSDASPVGTSIDMSFLLDAPAGKHGGVTTEGEKLVFADGTEARFWGTQLLGDWWNQTDEQLAGTAERLAAYGCNLVMFDTLPDGAGGRLQDLLAALKPRGIYLDLTSLVNQELPDGLVADPAVLKDGVDWTMTDDSFSAASHNPSATGEFQDLPTVLMSNMRNPLFLILGRLFGSPYRAGWSEDWPNEYLGEIPPLMAAYGSFDDWTACVGMGMGGTHWGGSLSPAVSLYDTPQLLIQWPAAALAFLRKDVKQGRFYDLENAKGMLGDMIGANQAPDMEDLLKALAHCSGVNKNDPRFKTDSAGTLKAKINLKQKSFVSDTGQISWQGNVGVFQVSSPRFQAAVGFLGNRKLVSPVWQVETPNFFASLSLVSLTKTNLWASDHMLLTGVTRMENTGQVYNAAKTKLISLGKGPILVEPLQAKITLFRYMADPKLRIRALDANGQSLQTKVHVKWVKNNLVFSWVPGAFYLEIFNIK